MEKANKVPEISTPNLHWELLSKKYVQEIFKEFTDEVTKYLRASTPKAIEEEEEWIVKSQEKYKQWTAMGLLVTDTEGEFIWCCEIMGLTTNTPELGLWLKASARWKWYGKEMIGALIQRLENHKKFDYIIYRACKDNVGSRKIAESFDWVLQLNAEGKENIFLEDKFNKSSSFEAVEYRIYPKK